VSNTGDVEITILDGGGSTVQVASSSLQVVLGCADSGTVGEIVSTRSLSTLSSTFTAGPLMEAAGMAVNNGGTVLAVRLTANTAGFFNGADRTTVTVTGATNATPTVITATAHGLLTGSIVTIAGVGGNTGANGTWKVTVLSSDTFSIPVDTTGGSSFSTGGTVQFTGLIMSGTGTSVPTVTGTPNDTYYVQIDIVKGGTIAANGIVFTISLDAGRSKGPNISLGTSTTYAISGTGITVTFGSGTLVAGDRIRFSTTEPAWNTSGVAAALTALLGSQYAAIGWGGGTHLVGTCAESSAAAFAASGSPALETLASAYIFTRGIVSARDVHVPAAWGGPASAESESTWMGSIEADYGALSANRIMACAGHYNMTSAFTKSAAGAPTYRRPLGWAAAARQVAIPPQRHSGRFRRVGRDGGPLEMIVQDPTNDPKDGFIYHDERINPGLDRIMGGAGRFCAARTRIGAPGVFIANPILSSAPGSDFDIYPKGAVMDVACSIAHQTGQQSINDDVRLNKGGTIFENDAKNIEGAINDALRSQMVAAAMCSEAAAVVDRDWNVKATNKLKTKVRIRARGYILEHDIEIGYGDLEASTT
jgi:uncharacterized protein DUF2586/ubiquitin-activating enzyme E1-like protein